MHRVTTFLLAALLFSLVTQSAAAQARVELKQANDGWTLLRDGQPYFIQGAGGDASKPLLKQCGGNSFRTWGIGDDTQAKLDEAQKLGQSVTLGIWLGHERHGFKYNNVNQVAEQYEKAKQAVLKFKDHPALLMWSIGNEMEGYAAGDNAAIWSAVNSIAAMIKELDPNHPTMTVIAEIGGARVQSIHQLCPKIDVIGINTYGGGPSIAQRYRAAGGTKPYVITEFGPPGTWETEKNSWDAPVELTSTAKADRYRETYEKSIAGEKGKLCLGSYVFAWGSKQEATATWYGLFLPSGERLEALDTMTELWSGKKVANACPRVENLEVLTKNRVEPGETIRVKLSVKDPENDKLKIEWQLFKDLAMYDTGGDTQPVPPNFPDAIVKNGETEVELKMPADGGGYWLYAIARDPHNGAAVANVPLYVNGPIKTPEAAKAKLPLVVYADDMGGKLPYIWSGWMGKIDAIGMDEKHSIDPHAGATCMKLQFRSPDNFGGIIWQSPANDWGDAPGGYNLTGAKKVTFWARGEEGGEKVNFMLGVIGPEKKFHDSAKAELKAVALTKDWKQYEIDLTGKDLSSIKTGFGWSVGGQGKPLTFYLDNIRYE